MEFWCLYKVHTIHFTAGIQTQTVLCIPCGVLVSLQTHWPLYCWNSNLTCFTLSLWSFGVFTTHWPLYCWDSNCLHNPCGVLVSSQTNWPLYCWNSNSHCSMYSLWSFGVFTNTLTTLLLELKLNLFYFNPVEFWCLYNTLTTLLLGLKLFCIMPVEFWCLTD